MRIKIQEVNSSADENEEISGINHVFQVILIK